MGRTAKGKLLKSVPVRIDEDVQAKLTEFKGEYETINEGLRRFLLGSRPIIRLPEGVPQPTETLIGSAGPCVYGWRRGFEYLYIGKSAHGLRRPFGVHHVIDQAEPLLDNDAIDVWFVSADLMNGLELDLIRRLRPSLNKYNGILGGTPNRSIRLSDEAMEFIAGLSVVYGSPDKGILAIARILSPEALAAHAEIENDSSDLGKPEMVDSLKGVIQNIEAGNTVSEAPKVNKRSESVAQRKARETKEHAAALAESDTTARLTGRDDIEYDLENVPHRSVAVPIASQGERRPAAHYEVQPRKVKTLTRPHGSAEPKRRREQ